MFHSLMFLGGGRVRNGLGQIWGDYQVRQSAERERAAFAGFTEACKDTVFLNQRLCAAIEAHDQRNPDHNTGRPEYDSHTQRLLAELQEHGGVPDPTPQSSVEVVAGPPELLPPAQDGPAPPQ